MKEATYENHCPEVDCVWYPEEHCFFWKDGKCKATPFVLALTQPVWDKGFNGKVEDFNFEKNIGD